MDLEFLNGIYHVKTGNILTEDDFNTLKRLGRPMFFRYLRTKDYGHNSGYESIEKIIETELCNVRVELDQTANDNLISDIFFMENDLTNMKIIYKEVATGIKGSNFSRLRRFDQDALYEFFKYGNYKMLPKEHEELFKAINLIPLDYEIQDYLQALEKVTFNYYTKLAKSKKVYKALVEYLELKKGINNLLTLLKFKYKKANIDLFSNALLEETYVGKDIWLAIYESSNRVILDKLSLYFNVQLTEAISNYIDNHDIEEFRIELSKYVYENIKYLSYNSNTIGPIIYYLYLKEIESLKVRELYYEE